MAIFLGRMKAGGLAVLLLLVATAAPVSPTRSHT